MTFGQLGYAKTKTMDNKYRIAYSIEEVDSLEPLYEIISAEDEITATSRFMVKIIEGLVYAASKPSDVKILFVKQI